MFRLDPPIPVAIELDFFPEEYRPKSGAALSYGWIDYGCDFDLIWICGLNDGGKCFCVPNPKIRFIQNMTMGRTKKRKTIQEATTLVINAADKLRQVK